MAAGVELVGDRLLAAQRVLPDRMLEPPAVEDRLADQVEQRVDLLGRHANRTAARWLGRRDRHGLRPAVARRDFAKARRDLVHQGPDGLPGSFDMAANRVGRAEEQIGGARRELPVAPRAFEHILHRVREVLDLLLADHPGGALDRVELAEERVHRAFGRAPGLHGEQCLDDAVEPPRASSRKISTNSVCGALISSRSSASNTLSRSTMPTRAPSSRTASVT